MSKADEYRCNAADCIRIAERTTDLAARAELLEMARGWQALAGQAERNSRTDLVYETPPPPPEQRHPVSTQQQQQQQIQPGKEKKENNE